LHLFGRASKIIAVALAIAACVLITPSMKAGASTQTVSASASGDTQIRSANPNTNYGSATTITVDGDEPAGTGKEAVALIRFSLPSLPAGAVITDTKLRLNVTDSSTNTYNVYVMKKAWVEGQATWNEYKTGSSWAFAGGRDATDREFPPIASITPNTTGVQDFDLGAAFDRQVGDWIRGVEANNGIQLINVYAPDGLNFFTREVATASQRPQLVITYDDGMVADTTPPETTIVSGPSGTVDNGEATFNFSSEPNSTFECSLDGGGFASCTSPKNFTGLTDGSHTFQVKAKDAAGNTDATPATLTWTVALPALPPPPSGTLEKFEPAGGQVYDGVDANQHAGDTVAISTQKWADYSANVLGGEKPLISHTFTGYDTNMTFDTSIAKARGAVPLITWQTGSGTSPKTIANAGQASSGNRSDYVILKTAYALRTYGQPVFLRVDQEMNAYWFAWCAYNSDGTPRANTTEDFKDMWRRMHIIFDGGTVSSMNQKLAVEGMPPLDPAVGTSAASKGLSSTTDPNATLAPTNNVAFVFNPVDAPGIPNKAGNQWADYYPGDAYVEWVGQTSYDTTWNATMDTRFSWLEAFYQDFSVGHDKPYMMGEWGLTSSRRDDPAYIQRIIAWQKAHPGVKALIYFNVQTAKTDHRLESYPNSAAVMRTDAPRYLNQVSTP